MTFTSVNRTVKKYSLFALIALFSVAALSLTGFSNFKEDQVRHIVVFKYKQGTTEQEIRQVAEAFADLKKTIPGIVSFEYGVNDSPEHKNAGFTHVYMVTFENAKARDTYLSHPEHKKFLQLLGKLGVLEDLFVVDYSARVKL